MTRLEKIHRQTELCRLLCESLCENVENVLPYDDHVYFNSHPNFSVTGYTQIDNDIVKLRRELKKLGDMTGGRYER